MFLKRNLYLKGFFVVLIFAVFPALFQPSPALALSADPNQHFDPTPVSIAPTPTPTTGPAYFANWTVTHSGATIYGMTNTTSNATGDNLNSEPSPLTSGIVLAAGNCPACAVTITYTDPNPTGLQTYIEVEVYTQNIGRQFQIVATDTASNSVTHTAIQQNLLYDCAGGGIQASQTNANTWTTLWVNTSGLLNPVQTVNIIIPSTFAGTMNTNQVFLDNMEGVGNLPCLIPPTETNTPTNTATSTATNSPTVTPTDTPTNSPTFTDSPTNTPTKTSTSTPTNTPTITPTNSPTLSPTNTFPATNTPTSAATPTNTPPSTPTQSPTVTPSNTPTKSPTNSSTTTPTNTPTKTPTITPPNTVTNTPTNTVTSTVTITPTNSPTNTITLTFTLTNTLTPTNTFTITPTPTNTFTPPPSPTFTETPCPVLLYPNPMDFQAAHTIAACPGKSCIVIGCVPAGSTVNIYTVSLMLVRTFVPGDLSYSLSPSLSVATITWDGNNGDGNPVASGFYLYVIDGPNGKTFGKFAISRSRNAP